MQMNVLAGSPAEVFGVSLRLGLTSFGGPIAHLGYFERTYVRQRRWLSGEEYAGLVSLCQLLPGPTSSQVGFLIGLRRAGWPGALAAWLGFTLPSALLMYGFGALVPRTSGSLMRAVLHGLMLAAVVVVAQAVWSMGRILCADRRRVAIALLVAAVLLLGSGEITQIAALVGGGLLGGVLCRKNTIETIVLPTAVNPRLAWIAFEVFCGLLIALPILTLFFPHGLIALTDIFYRAGALVFGGGHVVLPLLQRALVPIGWVSDGTFLSGYGFAQALPGPLFTIAAYLGAASAPGQASLLWAALALLAIFLPGLLLSVAGLALWARLAHISTARAALAGINAAVVGLLGAALYNPVWTTAVHSALDLALTAVGFALLQWSRAPAILVVALCVAASVTPVLLN